MASNNDIGWGQGHLNNTIGWGKGSANNTNGWGSVYDSSESGETILNPNVLFVDARFAFSFDDLGLGATNAVKVRRSSDSAEQDFTFAEITDGTLVSWVGVGNDGLVTIWYNQQIGNANFTQVVQNAQPKIVDNGSLVVDTYGNPSISFDGVNDHMLSGITDSQFSQLFVAHDSVSNAVIGFSGAVSLQHLQYNTTDDNINFSASTGLFTIDNINVKGRLNGVDETGGATTFTQIFNRFILGSINGSVFNLDGKVTELIKFDFADDQASNIESIENNINSRLNIY